MLALHGVHHPLAHTSKRICDSGQMLPAVRASGKGGLCRTITAERPVGWLEGVLDDTPLELDAESGGPGDDVDWRRQASGIAGQAWAASWRRYLERSVGPVRGISVGRIDAGVLAVCPNSSGTIREALAEAIVRLGTGRSDELLEIGQAWAERLSSASLTTSTTKTTSASASSSGCKGRVVAEKHRPIDGLVTVQFLGQFKTVAIHRVQWRARLSDRKSNSDGSFSENP